MLQSSSQGGYDNNRLLIVFHHIAPLVRRSRQSGVNFLVSPHPTKLESQNPITSR